MTGVLSSYIKENKGQSIKRILVIYNQTEIVNRQKLHCIDLSTTYCHSVYIYNLENEIKIKVSICILTLKTIVCFQREKKTNIFPLSLKINVEKKQSVVYVQHSIFQSSWNVYYLYRNVTF